jgi:uncharacterized protein YecA (UPF0149 family)
VASIITYHGVEFDRALQLTAASARQCARYAGDPRTLLLRYESEFTDDPATLDRLAARLGATLTAADRKRIFAETRRPAIERYISGIAQMPTTLWSTETGDFFDPTTHWHHHHAGRTGEIGRWRRVLNAAQVSTIERLFRRTGNYVSRNAPCPCGSGLRYKQCHGRL